MTPVENGWLERRQTPTPALSVATRLSLDQWATMAGEERTIRVRWLLDPDSEPLRNAQITEQNGRLLDLRTFADDNAPGLLPLLVCPQFANAHTHLEFSGLRQPLQPALPFPDWIQSVIKWRQAANDGKEAIRQGLEESKQFGVRLIGEIATQNSVALIDENHTTIVQFREVIGLRPERIQQQLNQAEAYFFAPPQQGIIQAISPHAPYTVHPDLLSETVSLAVRHHIPVAMHLAETMDEIRLLEAGEGRFVEFLSGMGLFDQATFPGGRNILELLQQLAGAPHVLAVHGNYFGDEEIRFLAKNANMTTVYCPRTHHYFGHPPHPFRKLLSAGCRVILGTDSRASNPDLNIWKELQHVARLASGFLSPGRLLAMITTHAACAMGINPDRFQFRPGGPFCPVFLRYDENLSGIEAIMQDPSTEPILLST